MSEEQKKLPYIAIKIKELRKESDWNQATLAKESGVSPAAISLIEKGERFPSMIVMRKLAQAFKVTIGELTGEPIESAEKVNEEAKVFFRNWHEINELEESDKRMIKEIVTRLREQNSDKG